MTGDLTRRNVLRSVGTAAVGIPMAAMLASCSKVEPGGGAAPDTLAKAKEQGYLRVAIANEPPYTKVEADGTVTGVEPDILAAVAKKLGIKEIQGTTVTYDSMIPGLNANRWDVIAAGLFMKQSRCEAVAYAEPVIVSTESFGVPKGNPKKITTVADVLANKDLKIAVLTGGFEEGILKTAKVPTDQQVVVKDARSGIEAVKAKRADAFLLPTLSLEDLLKDDKDMEITEPVEDAPKTGSSAAFRKDDTKLQEAYNAELKKFKETGEFDEILKKWGFDPTVVKGVTAEELCKNPG
ncbi:ectoine/hydroxyectoine ABC transporter substrate-binding protein EhuB [Saxibacter everestensis]|uniref:Ectoine/hydroxyectoine ABC transporter substrate-binding protein EhuB n=1 Tax=Saxibacter everestensis TaxID=2909229 RepID=A0ABY8QTZ7_9MICO|nr:ectoine/hydroxyectoine ABC transporter substrate-binding protein EhuB [Brevibacteriaceae bacterium ZFBP1038]